MYGTNPERFKASYLDLAKQLHVKGCDEPNADILDLVRRWLCDETNGNWLMILDNVDDGRSVTRKEDGEDYKIVIRDYIPQAPHGMVLLTFRDQTAAYDMAGHRDCIIQIEVMSAEDTLELLKTKLGEPQTSASNDELVCLIQKLDSIPLAVTQAAAYISQNTLRSVAQYIERLDRSETDPDFVLNTDNGDLRRDSIVPNAVFRTQQITLDLIRDERPSAAELFSTMAMFDRQGVPEFLLDQPDSSDVEDDTKSSASSGDEYNASNASDKSNSSDASDAESQGQFSSDEDHSTQFSDNIEVLLQYSLITLQTSQRTYQMHRLVQLAATTSLRSQGSLQTHKEKALFLLAQAHPRGNVEDRDACRASEPHVDLIMRNEYDRREARLARAKVLWYQAVYFLDQSKNKTSEEQATRALRDYNELLGEDHEGTLDCQQTLGLAFENQGFYSKVEEHILKYLAMSRNALGETHPVTMDLFSDLSSTYRDQGRYDDAIEAATEVLTLARDAWGEKDKDTLRYSKQLATIFIMAGRYSEAETLLRSVLE